MARITLRSIVTVAACVVLTAVSAVAQRNLEIVGGDTHNWGTVDPGKLTTVAVLRNNGPATINIVEVRPTCLCTIAPMDKYVLAPGDSGRMSITLDVSSRMGLVERNIRICAVDSSVAGTPVDTMWLHLKADVYRDITVTPANTIIVGTAKVGQEARAMVLRIKNNSDKPVRLETPTLADGANVQARFELTVPMDLKPGEEYQLKSYVTPFLPGEMRGQVTIRTNSARTPEINLAIAGRVAVQNAAPAPPSPPPAGTSGR